MFFDADLLVVAGVIFAATALFWNRSFVQLAWAHAGARAVHSPVAELPFMVAQRGAGARKAVLRRMVPAVVAVHVPGIASVKEAVVVATAAPETGRLSVDRQVARIAEIVTRAVDGARDADRLHHAAHEQLDAADYALQNLMHELSAVMRVPGAQVARPETSKPAAEVAAMASFATAMAA
jgi:hypothetical protein